MILYLNSEGVPIARQIASIACDIEGLCMKDNDFFATCEVISNSDGPYDHKTQ